MDYKLKTCPFCGSTAKVISYDFGDCHITTEFAVCCDGVDQHQLDTWEASEQEAAAAWNTRA